jgi:DNA-binding NtrC family response regulator
MDGIEFLASVRRIDPNLPVIMTSDHPSVETYLKALNAGVFDFVARPVSSPLLRRIMTVALKETGLARHSLSPRA